MDVSGLGTAPELINMLKYGHDRDDEVISGVSLSPPLHLGQRLPRNYVFLWDVLCNLNFFSNRLQIKPFTI